CIIKDSKGLMYFANNGGILEFDGTRWNKYTVPNNSIIRSLAIDSANKIYAGAYDELGYLYTEANNKLTYRSLVNKINKNDRGFGELWKIYPTNDGIYFQSFTYIFKYTGDTIYTVYKNGNFHFSFLVDNELYIRDNDAGLKRLTSSGLQLIPGGEIFKDMEIWTIFPFDDTRLLIGTANHGLFLYNGIEFIPWNVKSNDFFKQNQIFSGNKIDNNRFVFGTIQNGIVIINKQGEIIQHINREKGIQNNTILSLFVDNEKNLWLGLDNGIDFIKINSPISYLNPRKGIGAGYAAIIYNKNLYLGTNQGLFVTSWDKQDKSFQYSNIKLVENTKGQVWNLTEIDGTLFCGHNKGALIVTDSYTQQISDIQGGWVFLKTPENPNLLIEGTYTGLSLLEKKGNSWKFKNIIKGFYESSREAEFDKNGYLWVGHGYKGIYRLKFNEKLDSVTNINRYSTREGLPSKYNNSVLRFKDEIVFSTEKGFYEYDENTETIIKHKKLDELFNPGKVSKLIEDQNGNIWFFQNNEIGILRLNYDGTYTSEILPFNEIYGSFIQSFESILPIDKDNIIIGSEDGFIHFSPSAIKYQDKKMHVLIRKVTLTKNDSVLFGGVNNNQLSKQINILKYKENALKLIYSAPDYTNIKGMTYSHFLEGFDEKWSDWRKESEKEYSNLHEGTYSFRVKAKDAQGYITPVSIYNFIIQPPWYRTIGAYVFYSIFIFSLLYLGLKLIFRKFEKEKELLKEKQKKELKAKELLHAQEVDKAEQQIIKLQNEKLEIDLKRQKAELENKTKELASIAMQITYKNEILEQVKSRLSKVTHNMIHEESKKQVLALIKTIENEMIHEEDWEKFEYHFDQVHEDFLKKMRTEFPELTPKDLKLCA
ncbi:MAG: hypothetical protein JXB17_07750, partial [Bacteroidales bacterium]|nr:hypothetical protein [Bacteroidales bacterium]